MDRMKNLQQLINIASNPLGRDVTSLQASTIPTPVHEILLKKNGFYAFESALLIRPTQIHGSPMSLEDWNRHETWIECFDNIPPIFFFAENIFGEQFGWFDGRILRFDPETSEISDFCETIREWASMILEDYDYLTGYSLAREWQEIHGPLRHGRRLVPYTPFVLGGGFDVSNLKEVDECEAIRIRAGLASKIRDLPDGSKISIEYTD